MTELTDQELLFIAYLLECGADAITQRICEEYDPEAQTLFTSVEKEVHERRFQAWNSGGKDYLPNYFSCQGSYQSASMQHRIVTYLAAKHGLRLTERFDLTSAMQTLCAVLRPKE